MGRGVGSSTGRSHGTAHSRLVCSGSGGVSLLCIKDISRTFPMYIQAESECSDGEEDTAEVTLLRPVVGVLHLPLADNILISSSTILTLHQAASWIALYRMVFRLSRSGCSTDVVQISSLQRGYHNIPLCCADQCPHLQTRGLC